VPVPPEASKKQQREAARAEKVAEFKKKQAAGKRNRIIAIVAASIGGAAVIGLIIAFIVVTTVPKVDPASISIEGLQTFDDLPANHVTGAVDYEAEYGANPPAGGNHNQVWLNCGVYTEVQANENAVHALEHGAVWVTYDASQVTGDDLATLQDSVPSTFSLVSPYEGLPSPVVISAWGAQVDLDSVDDPRLEQFVDKFWRSADLPEQGAPCTGGVDGPGKIS
jgi:hypothetical protein